MAIKFEFYESPNTIGTRTSNKKWRKITAAIKRLITVIPTIACMLSFVAIVPPAYRASC